MLRSEEEQFGIISSFASWLKISPVKLQFKSFTRKADSGKHIAMVREELEAEENEACKKQGEGYIRFIRDVGNREALTRRFFLIFQYEEVRRGDGTDKSEVYSLIQTVEQNARTYFSQCGNTIIQPEDPDEATAEILYMFFNRNSCVEEPFTERIKRVVSDAMASKGKVIGIDDVPKIRMAHFVSPRGIDFSHTGHIVMDGIYYSFLYIKGEGCNTYVRTHAGTNIPIGTMANEELRSLRRTAHYYFNRLYLSGLMSRNEAYLWLSEQLSAPLSEAHIGKLGEYYCRQVIEKSKKMLEEYTRKGKIKGKVYSIHENDRGTEGEGRNKYGTGRKSNCG